MGEKNILANKSKTNFPIFPNFCNVFAFKEQNDTSIQDLTAEQLYLTMADIETLLQSFIGLLDVMAELYLGSIMRPLLLLHEEIFSKVNSLLRQIINENPIPDWLTANVIAYSRAVLVIPTILLLAWGQLMLPAIFVLVTKLCSVFHQVVFTYWMDVKKVREEEANEVRPTSKSSSTSDDDDYEYGTLSAASSGNYLCRKPPHSFYSVRGCHNGISTTNELLESQPSQSNLWEIFERSL